MKDSETSLRNLTGRISGMHDDSLILLIISVSIERTQSE